MIGGVLLEFLIIPLNFILKSNVQFTLAYMDEQVEWKVKKHIARFTYQLKKYKTGKRFGGNYIYAKKIFWKLLFAKYSENSKKNIPRM